MFEYAKKDFEDKINELDEQLISDMFENDECFGKIKHVDSCLKLKRNISKDKKLSINTFVCSTIMLMLSMVLNLVSSVPFSFIAESLTLVSIFGYAASAGYFIEGFRLNNELNNEYSDFVLVSEEELVENRKQLLDKERNLHNNIEIIKTEKNRYMEGVRRIELYQSVLSSVDELSNNPYFVADSKEEYQESLDNKEFYSKQFDDYLSDTNYGDIYFSNEIVDAPVKKLVRK